MTKGEGTSEIVSIRSSVDNGAPTRMRPCVNTQQAVGRAATPVSWRHPLWMMRRAPPRRILAFMSIETFWTILAYAFVFGVAGVSLWVFVYWYTLPQRHPVRRA
jgi:hypothetical protein